MTVKQILHNKRDEIHRIAQKHGAYNVRAFGSVVRGEETKDSDIDLLVETKKETSSWFPAGLILELEKLLGRRVEIVTNKALNPDIREYVLNEATPL